MTWLPATAAGATSFDRVFGLRPDLYADYRAFESLFWSSRPVDPVLIEICRLRIAQLLRCDPEQRRRSAPATAAGLTEQKISALDDWYHSMVFSEVERACLAFAEKFVLDPRGVTDEDAAAVTAHLSPPEMVAFTEALALFDGFTRFRLMLGIGPDEAD